MRKCWSATKTLAKLGSTNKSEGLNRASRLEAQLFCTWFILTMFARSTWDNNHYVYWVRTVFAMGGIHQLDRQMVEFKRSPSQNRQQFWQSPRQMRHRKLKKFRQHLSNVQAPLLIYDYRDYATEYLGNYDNPIWETLLTSQHIGIECQRVLKIADLTNVFKIPAIPAVSQADRQNPSLAIAMLDMLRYLHICIFLFVYISTSNKFGVGRRHFDNHCVFD